MHHPTDRIAYITAFVTLVVEHLMERSDDPSHHEQTLYHGATFRSFPACVSLNGVVNVAHVVTR